MNMPEQVYPYAIIIAMALPVWNILGLEQYLKKHLSFLGLIVSSDRLLDCSDSGIIDWFVKSFFCSQQEL